MGTKDVIVVKCRFSGSEIDWQEVCRRFCVMFSHFLRLGASPLLPMIITTFPLSFFCLGCTYLNERRRLLHYYYDYCDESCLSCMKYIFATCLRILIHCSG